MHYRGDAYKAFDYRCYFERCLNHDKERAEYALDQIGMLYNIKTLGDGRHLDYGQRAS